MWRPLAPSGPSGRAPVSWLISGPRALPSPDGNQLLPSVKNLRPRHTRSSGGNPGSSNQPRVLGKGTLPPSLMVHLHGAVLPGRRSFPALVQTIISLCCLSLGPHFTHWDLTLSLLPFLPPPFLTPPLPFFLLQIFANLVWVESMSAFPSACQPRWDEWPDWVLWSLPPTLKTNHQFFLCPYLPVTQLPL